MANLTLFDLFTLQRNDVITGLIEDVVTLAPEFNTFSAVARPGWFYEVVRRTGLPAVGFRNVNAGTTPGKSAFKKEIKEMFFLDGLINVDEAVLKADDASSGDVWQHESRGILRQALITIGAQVYYGTSADANGFVGLRSQLSGSVQAGGTTSSTSAYLVWMDEKEGVRFDVGKDGAVNLPPPMRQQLADPNASTKSLFYWVSNLSCWLALTVLSAKSVWAVTGITTASGQALTDVLASQLVALIPVARRNNLRWFMNRTSESVLQQSRTAINPGIATYSSAYALQPGGSDGRPAFPPKPNALDGYPITLTDSLTNTESN